MKSDFERKSGYILSQFLFISLFCVIISFSSIVIADIKYYISAIFTAFLSLSLCVCFLVFRDKNRMVSKYFILLLIFLLYQFLNSLINKTIDNVYLYMGFILPFMYIFMQYIKYYFTKAQIAKSFLICLLILALSETIIGLFQYVIQSMIIDSLPYKIKTLVYGTIYYPNGYGAFLGITSFGYLIAMMLMKSWFKKVLLLSLYLCSMFVIVINQSRGTWLTIFASYSILFVIYMYYRYKKKIRLFLLLVGLVICCVFLFARFAYLYNVHSSEGRHILQNISLNIISDNPIIGIGLNNYGNVFLDYQRIFYLNPTHAQLASKAIETTAPNNQYLKIFSELGGIGALIFILILFLAVKKGFFNLLKGGMNVVDIGLFYILLYICIHSCFDDMLDIYSIYYIFCVSIGLIFFDDDFILKPRFGKMLYNIFVCILLGGIFYYSCVLIKNYPALKYRYLAHSDLRKGDFLSALEQSRFSLAIDPYDAKAKEFEGRALIGAGKYSEGVLMLSKLLDSTNYQSKDLYLALIYGQIELGKYKEALQNSEKIHEMFPTHIRPQLLKSIIYKQLRQDSLAIKILENLADSTQSNSEAMIAAINFRNMLYEKFIVLDSVNRSILNDSVVLSFLNKVMLAH